MHLMHGTTPLPAELVRRARESKRLSQNAFGALFGKSQGVVSRYESGDVAPPAEVLMHCIHILALPEGTTQTTLEPAITGVRQALEALGRALDLLQQVAVSAGDAPPHDISHSPLAGEGSRS